MQTTEYMVLDSIRKREISVTGLIENAQECLVEFIKTFDASLDFEMWLGLIEEETDELERALGEEGLEAQLKETADLLYVLAGAELTLPQAYVQVLSKKRAQRGHDAVLAAFSMLAISVPKFGDVIVNEAVDRVHESNMSKLDDDGKPIRREDGKIMKGPNYKAPDLTDLAEAA